MLAEHEARLWYAGADHHRCHEKGDAMTTVYNLCKLLIDCRN